MKRGDGPNIEFFEQKGGAGPFFLSMFHSSNKTTYMVKLSQNSFYIIFYEYFL